MFYLRLISSVAEENKYTLWYCQLISKAANRFENREEAKRCLGYIETHHIVPRCLKLGGAKDNRNLVHLTAREHYIAHLLLTKMFRGTRRGSMLSSVFWLMNQSPDMACSRIYDSVRKAHSHNVSLIKKGIPVPPDILAARIGKKKNHVTHLKQLVHLSIDIADTIEKYGYDPQFLKPSSNKLVTKRYECCGVVQAKPFYAANQSCPCRTCLCHKLNAQRFPNPRSKERDKARSEGTRRGMAITMTPEKKRLREEKIKAIPATQCFSCLKTFKFSGTYRNHKCKPTQKIQPSSEG